MKPIRIGFGNTLALQMIVLLGSLCASFYIGYYTGGYQVNEMDRKVLDAATVGHRTYLIQRFTRAFADAPAIVAIWEGTNLLQYLGPAERDEMGSGVENHVFGIHTKLGSLYKEIHKDSEVEHEIDKATRILHQSSPNQTKAKAREVIQQLMQEEAKQRRVAPSSLPHREDR